jgi:hypothetical protein
MQAIAEFRHEVFETLKRVAEQRANAISQLMGRGGFEQNSEAVDDFLDGTDTFLSIFTDGAPCGFIIYVSWQDAHSAAPVRIGAGIWCDKKAIFEAVTKALQDRYGSQVLPDGEEYECYLEKPIQPEQFDKLESELGRLCDAWIRKLRAVDVRKLIRSAR